MIKDTFVIRDGAIHCLMCNTTSFNTRDVSEKYCGRCHLFHDAVAQAKELSKQGSHECIEWRTARGRCALCGRIVNGIGI